MLPRTALRLSTKSNPIKTASLSSLAETVTMESSSRRRRTRRRTDSEEKVVRKVIWPAIRGDSCPICLRDLEGRYREAAVLTRCNHAYCIDCIRRWSHLRRRCPLCNAEFDSWFYNLTLSSRTFQKELLPFQFQGFTVNSDAQIAPNQPRARTPTHRPLRRTRVALNNRRTRALPWRRSFGRIGLISSDVIALRKLEWRASIYNQGLLADSSTLRCLEPGCKGCGPCNLLKSLEKNPSGNKSVKDAVKMEILQRIEPWIRRDLQAVLGDPDPTVIVHVVTSQFIAWLEEKAKLPSGQLDVGDSFISPLHPFLHDKASIFWHELSCFAEGCYNMETYDAVVEYKHQE